MAVAREICKNESPKRWKWNSLETCWGRQRGTELEMTLPKDSGLAPVLGRIGVNHLRWFGYVTRMVNDRMAGRVYEASVAGNRIRGR